MKTIAPFYSAIVLTLVLILAWYNYTPRRRSPARKPTAAGRDNEVMRKDGVGSRLVFERKT